MKSIRFNFVTSSVMSITVDSTSAGYYSKEYNSGGLTSTYMLNASPVSLPFTLIIGDVLEINASAFGFVEIV